LKIQLNGQERTTEPGTTLAQLLAELGLDKVRVAVERNFEIVPRASYGRRLIDVGYAEDRQT
jgi:thiamine biosynthesis protein ThiS